VTWAEFALRLARALDLDDRLIEATPHARFEWAAPRPSAVALATERGQILPGLDRAIAEYARRAGECGHMHTEDGTGLGPALAACGR
jgi:dTDP-4-dehydrorhamnose reductase